LVEALNRIDSKEIEMNIKKLLLILLATTFAIGLAACNKPGPAEKLGQEIDQATEKAGDKIEDVAEKAGDKLDEAGNKIKDATDQ
jgi:hyperosmotically inducible periplasmic protein